MFQDQCHQQAGQATPVVQPTRTCDHCGASMEGKKTIARYCSRSCKENAKSKRETTQQQETRPTTPCATCGEPFVGRNARAKFCSEECSRVFYRKVPTTTNCGFCGEPIEGRTAQSKFCSDECRYASWYQARPVYAIWMGMKARCNNPKNPHYPRYGGRGIRVCPEWQNSFQAFITSMGPRPSPAHSIDRINANVHYEEGNCRWATPREQANNTTANRLITYRGATLSVAEWARVFNIPDGTLRGRLFDMKWDVQRAFTEPVRGYRKGRKSGTQ
jgi:predicted nucleic acid-binding Zn ribbon protein